QMAVTVAEMIDADFDPGIDRIERAVTQLAEVADVADGAADFDFVMKTLDMQAYFARYLFAQRDPDAGRLIELAHSRLQPRLDRYRYTPLRLLFMLADAQLSFM